MEQLPCCGSKLSESNGSNGSGRRQKGRCRGAAVDMVATQKVSDKLRKLCSHNTHGVEGYIQGSSMLKILTRYWMIFPKLLRKIMLSLNPADFMLLVISISYKRSSNWLIMYK